MFSLKSIQAGLQQAAGQAGAAVQGVAAQAQNVDASKFTKQFQTLSQQVRERTGNVEDITELPQEYLDLERRVDGLRTAHINLLKIAKVYDTPGYDYPTQIQETATELGGSIAHTVSSWAAAATKGTNLPQPVVAEKPKEVEKTLPHALSRAAATGAVEVGPSRLATVLKTYAVAQDKIGSARLVQDEDVSKNFIQPWSATLNSSLAAAIKSRQAVSRARVQLDACRGTLKNATGGPKQEQARLEVENAEEKLVNATEEAINLMRSVLENPEPLKNLASLIKAQQAYFAQAAEALASIQGEVEEASVQAEADYRKSRAQ